MSLWIDNLRCARQCVPEGRAYRPGPRHPGNLGQALAKARVARVLPVVAVLVLKVYRNRAAYNTHERQPYISEFEGSRRPCLLATNTIELTPRHVVMKDSLPRLAETFFDVRGSSRSMHVGRYAESEVPVISIFQGDMLIGSFRLPTEDIPRAAGALTLGPPSSDKNGGMRERRRADYTAATQAPSPRIGEVFFDVRGASRSMRLSCLNDTGIRVISLWEGGACTATFRLAAEEIPRLADAVTGTGNSHAA